MSFIRQKIRFEKILRKYGFTYRDVSQLLDIYKMSAKELTTGVIAIEMHELRIISDAFEIPMSELVSNPVKRRRIREDT